MSRLPKHDWLEVMHSFRLCISFASFYIAVLIRFLNLLAHIRESTYSLHFRSVAVGLFERYGLYGV